MLLYCVCFFKRKTAYEMRIRDWSSDVCSSDLLGARGGEFGLGLTQLQLRDGAGVELRLLQVERFAARRDRTLGDAELFVQRPQIEVALGGIRRHGDRTSVVYGKREAVSVDLCGVRIIQYKYNII